MALPVINRSECQKNQLGSNINNQMYRGGYDESIYTITNTLTYQLSGILIRYWKTLSDKTRST